MAKTAEHPSTRRAFREAAERWNDLKRSHAEIADRLWAGTIAAEFTGFELSLLSREGFISQHDKQLLRKIWANRDWT